jgi:hypothetical protein
VTNRQAYYDTELTTTVKGFIIQAPGYTIGIRNQSLAENWPKVNFFAEILTQTLAKR